MMKMKLNTEMKFLKKAGIWPREEKCYFFDFGHQNVRFLFQMVPYNEGSLTWVFFYLPWKCLKKLDMRSGRNWFPDWFWIFDRFFALLEVKDWFKHVIKVFFLGVLG